MKIQGLIEDIYRIINKLDVFCVCFLEILKNPEFEKNGFFSSFLR